mgnify:FL=1
MRFLVKAHFVNTVLLIFRLYDYAKRFARRLESQQGRQNPVVATWGSEKISTKALVWANQFVSGKERNWEKFIKSKMDELPPQHVRQHRSPVPIRRGVRGMAHRTVN